MVLDGLKSLNMSLKKEIVELNELVEFKQELFETANSQN